MPAQDTTPDPTPLDWPPPPHDPRERALVTLVNGWEVRVVPPIDRRYQYFVTRGFLHAQLWHRQARVSVLTPSRLTGGLFEVFPHEGWKAAVRTPVLLRSLVAQTHGVLLPSPRRLAAIVEWYVRAEERHAARPRDPRRSPARSPRAPAAGSAP